MSNPVRDQPVPRATAPRAAARRRAVVLVSGLLAVLLAAGLALVASQVGRQPAAAVARSQIQLRPVLAAMMAQPGSATGAPSSPAAVLRRRAAPRRRPEMPATRPGSRRRWLPSCGPGPARSPTRPRRRTRPSRGWPPR